MCVLILDWVHIEVIKRTVVYSKPQSFTSRQTGPENTGCCQQGALTSGLLQWLIIY